MLYSNRLHLMAGVLAGFFLVGCIDTGENPNPNPASPVFHTALRFPTGASPFAVRAADLNGDGLQDVISANFTGNSISILLGNASSSYALHTDYATGSAPAALYVGDLNGDGQSDVLTANSGSANLSLLFGTGEGTFLEVATLPLLESSTPLDVDAVDLDADGAMDIIVADSSNNALLVLRGLDGEFDSEAEVLPVGTAPRDVLIADLNGDGAPDLVAANRNSNNISVLLNDGAGLFAPANFIAAGANPRQVEAIDVDRDGDMDLVVSNTGSSNITIFLNDGAGLFLPGAIVPVDLLPSRFTKGDFDGDGNTDLAVLLFSTASGNPSLGIADVYYGNGTGGFPTFRRYGVGTAAQDITARDLNADGRLDLLVADSERSSANIVYGRISGIFASDERIPTGRQPREIVSVDLDRDGDLDLVVISQLDQRVTTYKNNGAGSFTEGNFIALTGAPRGLAVGLLNDDNNPDVVVTQLTGTQGVRVLLGKGDGTLLPTGGTTITMPGRGVRSVAIGDVNKDGFNDLVTGDSARDEISVILADGDGGYEAPVAFASGNYPINVSLVDANGDGNLDVVFLSRNDPDMPTDQALPRAVRILGKGDGTFDVSSTLRVETGGSPADLVLGDITGDGRPDAVVASAASNAAFTHTIRADGFIVPGTARFAGPGARAIALASTAPGANLDIITVNNNNSFTVIQNFGNGAFSGQATYNGGSGAIEVAAGDFNRDGAVDLALINQSTNDISIVYGVR